MTKFTIRELLAATKFSLVGLNVERRWWEERLEDDHLVSMDHKDEMEAAERVLAAATLAERVEKVLALHEPDESYTCGHCQTHLRCGTMRALEGE